MTYEKTNKEKSDKEKTDKEKTDKEKSGREIMKKRIPFIQILMCSMVIFLFIGLMGCSKKEDTGNETANITENSSGELSDGENVQITEATETEKNETEKSELAGSDIEDSVTISPTENDDAGSDAEGIANSTEIQETVTYY